MRIAMIIVRTFLGLLFVFSSVVYFLMVMGIVPTPPMEGPMKTFNEGLAASGYFFTLLKVTELVCGILLLTGRFVPLALVILAPIIINIFLVHLLIAPEGVWIGIAMILAGIFLAFCYRDAFKPLLTSRYTPAT
jgi:putative oxidoreductase